MCSRHTTCLANDVNPELPWPQRKIPQLIVYSVNRPESYIYSPIEACSQSSIGEGESGGGGGGGSFPSPQRIFFLLSSVNFQGQDAPELILESKKLLCSP